MTSVVNLAYCLDLLQQNWEQHSLVHVLPITANSFLCYQDSCPFKLFWYSSGLSCYGLIHSWTVGRNENFFPDNFSQGLFSDFLSCYDWKLISEVEGEGAACTKRNKVCFIPANSFWKLSTMVYLGVQSLGLISCKKIQYLYLCNKSGTTQDCLFVTILCSMAAQNLMGNNGSRTPIFICSESTAPCH